MNSYADSGEIKQGKRELQAKIILVERKIASRVSSTRQHQLPIPRLESFVEKLSLDKFERNLILLLIGRTVSPVVRTLIDALDSSSVRTDDLSVGQALSILCQDFASQIASRKYFYKSSKLMHHGVITLHKSRWYMGKGDLTEQKITLDRRVLDSIVGLDSEINELVEGSDLYGKLQL
jgi:hypothetical protein